MSQVPDGFKSNSPIYTSQSTNRPVYTGPTVYAPAKVTKPQATPQPQANNPAPQNNQPAAPSVPSEYDQYIDNIFNPAMGAYDQAEKAAGSGRDTQLQFLNTSKTQQTDDWTQTGSDAQNEAVKQEGILAKNKQSALEEATRYYNALKQRQGAMWGAFSSAGQAFGEIAGQEALRNQGKIQDNFSTQQGSIHDWLNNALDEVSKGKKQVEQWYADKSMEINNNFQQQLAQINSGRAQTQSQKAQMRMSILQDAINESRKWADMARQMDMQLKQYEEQARIQYKYETGQLFAKQPLAQSIGVQAPALMGAVNQNQNLINTLNPLQQKKEDDLASLNPFYA